MPAWRRALHRNKKQAEETIEIELTVLQKAKTKLRRHCRSHAAGACTTRSQEMALIGPRRKAAREFSRVQQFFHVDPRVVAHAFQEINQVFRRKISACTGAVGTAT
jgi:hypothetical protein